MEKHLAPYEGDLPYVFISYSHLDIELRDELLAAFNKEGIRFWFDDGLHSGDDWNLSIANHLLTAALCLTILTPNSTKSEYVKDELNFAKQHNIPIHSLMHGSFILPIDIELMAGRIQIVRMTGNYITKLKESFPVDVFTEEKRTNLHPTSLKDLKMPGKRLCSTSTIQQGSIIDERMVIDSLIESGFYGLTYRAHIMKTGEVVAIRVVHKESNIYQEYKETLERHTRLLKRIRHPSIVSIKEVLEDNQDHYVIMDYIQGQSLLSYVHSREMNDKIIVRLGKELCGIAGYLSSLTPKIIPDCFSCGDYMVNDEECLVLCNLDSTHEEGDHSRNMGTILNIAPERFGGIIDARSYVYSIGMLLYYISSEPNLKMHSSGNMLSFDDLVHHRVYKKTLSQELLNVLKKCCRVEPDNRYQTIFELIKAFDNIENNVQDSKGNIRIFIEKLKLMIGKSK